MPNPQDAAPGPAGQTSRTGAPPPPGNVTAPRKPPPLDRRRYLRVVLFLSRVFVHVLWWDVLLRRFAPFDVAGRTADRRWRSLAARYRRLAVRLGGVLIKMGQFLSIRVDVLPPSVTEELAGLQDEVPPEDFTAVEGVIAHAFGEPPASVFRAIDPDPLGSASLAQAHRAELPDGHPVVVKVQRPRIATLVETDLAAFHFAVRVLRRFGWIKRRVDMDLIYDEFARITRAELDFEAEGRNAEAFAAQFADDPRVRVPHVYWSHTRPRVLTLEDVTGLKVTDMEGMAAAGLARGDVASALVDIYFEQFFVHNFVHVDPHPGNLFVHPGRPPGVRGDAPDFQIAFIDFGMMAVVPERVRIHLRDYMIGFATRDPARIVRAYQGAGVLLPGADLRRIEQAQAAVFDQFWGVRMGDLQEMAMREAGAFMAEYSDLLRDMPFQLPADLLFIGRAIGILSGLATTLDPDFDIWAAVIPYARGLAVGDGEAPPWTERLGPAEEPVQTLIALLSAMRGPAQSLVALPGGLERLVNEATAGQLSVQCELAPAAREDVRRIESAASRLTWAVVFAALLLSGVVVRSTEGPDTFGTVLFIGAGIAFAVMLFRR